MEFTTTETRLIDLIIHLESELDSVLDTAYPNREQSDRDTCLSHNLCVAFGVPHLGPIVNPLLDSGVDRETVESALAASGYTLSDLEQHTELEQFVSERHLARADQLRQLLLDYQQRTAGPDSGELIHFPHHRTIQ